MLTPLALLYRAAEATRRRLTNTKPGAIPVICVGNFTAGGAGKSPTVRFLATHLSDGPKGAPAILSRGYGGTLGGPLKLDPTQHTAHQTGDEPMMLAAYGDTPLNVYIGADRHATATLAAQDGHDWAIKDDGFQNPAMRHAFNLLVVDGGIGLGNGRLLPAGPLRQPLPVALQNTDAVLVLGAERHHTLTGLHIACETGTIPVYRGRVSAKQTGTGQVIGWCAIAHPEKFRATLQEAGYDPIRFEGFGDHHRPSEPQAQRLLDISATEKLPLITTAKDMARLHGSPSGSATAALAAASQVLDIDLTIDDWPDLRDRLLTALA